MNKPVERGARKRFRVVVSVKNVSGTLRILSQEFYCENEALVYWRSLIGDGRIASKKFYILVPGGVICLAG